MVRIDTDISGFLRSVDKISIEIAEAIVKGVAKTAETARDAVRQKTRASFKLRSDYIPQSVRSMPDPSRAKAIAGATKSLMGRRKRFQGAVYLKGSRSPKKSLAFMLDHELGNVRKPVSGQLAVPVEVKQYRFRGSRGAVLYRWKPKKILEHFNRVGAADKGSKKFGKTRGKPKPFIHKGMIVRLANRGAKKFEILYSLSGWARLKRRWGFVETAHRSIRTNLSKDIVDAINKLK